MTATQSLAQAVTALLDNDPAEVCFIDDCHLIALTSAKMASIVKIADMHPLEASYELCSMTLIDVPHPTPLARIFRRVQDLARQLHEIFERCRSSIAPLPLASAASTMLNDARVAHANLVKEHVSAKMHNQGAEAAKQISRAISSNLTGALDVLKAHSIEIHRVLTLIEDSRRRISEHASMARGQCDEDKTDFITLDRFLVEHCKARIAIRPNSQSAAAIQSILPQLRDTIFHLSLCGKIIDSIDGFTALSLNTIHAECEQRLKAFIKVEDALCFQTIQFMQKAYSSLTRSIESTKASMRKHRAKQFACLKNGLVSSSYVAREKHITDLAAHLCYLTDLRNLHIAHEKEGNARMEEIDHRAKHHPFNLALDDPLFSETTAWGQEESKMMGTANLMSIE